MFLSTLLYAIFSGIEEAKTTTNESNTSDSFLDDLDPLGSNDSSLLGWGFVLDDENDDSF